jgi:hypothetical protein
MTTTKVPNSSNIMRLVGNLPKGYVRNVPLPRVPESQRAECHQVLKIPDYYEDSYVGPTYDTTRRLVESAAYAFSPAWHAIAINTQNNLVSNLHGNILASSALSTVLSILKINMDVTISFDEVTMLLGCILTLELRLNVERIKVLCRHFEQALQCLPCPQSTLHGWEGLVMARQLYALLLLTPFRHPTDPGANAVYMCPINPNNPGVVPDPAVPLKAMEQSTIDTTFARCKHYYQSLLNIERACFAAWDASINIAFQVSNDPSIQGWHAGMSTLVILDQLSDLYGHPTLAILEQNDRTFCSPYLAANLLEVLFRQIQDCTEIALLGCDPYTDCQLINNTIHLLLMVSLYLHPFEDWDHLLPKLRLGWRFVP